MGVVAGLIFSVVSLFPTGSFHAENIARFQPAKMAAMEGVFETQSRAGMAIIGMPDSERKQLMDPIVVPGVLSYLIYGDTREEVIGLNDIPEDQHPPVEIVYYAYHIMVGLGTIFIAIFAISGFQLWRGRLFASRGVLWALMLAMPFPYIANHAGWVVAEVGRQPWIVYGLRRIGGGDVAERDRRDDVLHAVRVHGAVRAGRIALPAPRPADRARRAGAGPRARALGRARAHIAPGKAQS